MSQTLFELHAIIARAIVRGPWERLALVSRLKSAVTSSGEWRRDLARRLFREFGTEKPSREAVLALLPFVKMPAHSFEKLMKTRRLVAARMPEFRFTVRRLATAGQLADWLGVSLPRLDWLADLRGLCPRAADARLRHYLVRSIAKCGGRLRVLEIPKATLKAVQSRILRETLDAVSPHEAAHAFRAGRSPVTFAAPHAGRAVVIRFDLRDFFLSIRAARVAAIFATVGYHRTVARLLAGLCTTRLADGNWRDGMTPSLRARHLPQGAPTSPALANLAAYRLDLRLTALAERFGAVYTRYADDLAFSGDESFAGVAPRFRVMVGAITLDEGFQLNYRKTRVMGRAGRQHLAGLVVNDRPNLPRDEFDRLKAILTNCARTGPAGQNRDGRADFRAVLRGRIAHVAHVNPARGAKLLAVFDTIHWEPN